MTDNDAAATTTNKGYYVWAWGSSLRNVKFVGDHEYAPSLVESLAAAKVCQIASQTCPDQEKAASLMLNTKGQVQQFHMSQLWRTPPFYSSLIKEVISQIACGHGHSAAVGSHGSLWTWGHGSSGALGHGTTDYLNAPKQVEALKEKTVTQVDCGVFFTVALTQDSSLYSWGDNDHGKTGHGIEDGEQLIPQKIDALDNKSVVQISTGSCHTAAKTASGSLFTWGYGTHGPLGHGNREDCLMPTLVEAFRGKEIVQVTCGAGHSAAVTQTGLLYTFGYNQDGQLGVGDKEHRGEPILVKTLEGLHVQQVSCGSFHTVATTNKGVYTWGKGRNGQLGHGTTEDSLVPKKLQHLAGKNVSGVAAFREYAVALVEQTSSPTDEVPTSESLRAMVNDEERADLKFMLEDGEEVFAHSCILCKRSDYFKAMLSSGMKESKQTSISIPNACKKIFLLLLEYIYVGAVAVDVGDAVELYLLADMHGLKKLQDICCNAMKHQLSAANVGQLLQSSASKNCVDLKKICVDFVVQNAVAICESGSLKYVTDLTIHLEIFTMMALSKQDS